MFEKEALPLVEDLQNKSLLAKDASLPTITRETTRYLVKQQQKLAEASEEHGKATDNDTTLLQVQLLHQIVSVFYLVVQVSYTSAVALLHTSLQQLLKDTSHIGGLLQYVDILKACFRKFRGFLSSEENSAESPHVHPKIAEVRERLYKWFCKQRSKVKNAKAVLICSTRCRYLFMKLCKELIKPHETYPEVRLKPISVVVDVDELKKADVLSAFEKNDILILGEQMIFEDFPWNIVGLLIEYEPQANSPWKALCAKLTIKHLCFESILPNVSVDLDETVPVRKFQNETSKLIEEKPSLVLIGSEKFTALGNLLHLMETRYEMLVVERDYSQFKEGFHPDLILDAKTCIVLESITDLQEQDGGAVKSLLSILTMLTRKFMTCYVIVTSASCDNEQTYPLGGSAPLNIARLQASVKQLSNCTENFQVSVLICFSVESFAETLSTLANKTLNMKMEDTKRSRSWISHEMSPAERFLLHLPCVNSFVAQRLLSVTGLHEICRMTLDDLLSTCDALDIPGNIAQDLHGCLNAKFETSDLSHSYHKPGDVERPSNMHPRSDLTMPSGDVHSYEPKLEISDDVQRCNYASFTQPVNHHPNKVYEAQSYYNAPVTMDHTNNGAHKCEVLDLYGYPSYNEILHDDNKQTERPFLSQYPLNNADALESDNTGCVQPHNDVDKLMVNTQKKLEEFVRLNPDRLRNEDAHPSACMPSRSVSNSFFPTNISHSFFSSDIPPMQSQSPYSSAVPCYPTEGVDACRFSTAPIQNTNPFPNIVSNPYSSYSKSEPFCEPAIEQPCCSFQSARHPTSFVWKPHNVERDEIGSGIPQDYFGNDVKNAFTNHLTLNREEHFGNAWPEPTVYPLHQNEPFYENTTRNSSNDAYVTGTSGSANIGIAQPFLQQPWLSSDLNPTQQMRSCYYPRPGYDKTKVVVMTPNMRKKALKYEKIPGSKDGQTRLTFY